MSRKTGQTWKTSYYQVGVQSTKENAENAGLARVKDGNLEATKSRQFAGGLGGPGRRTVLSSLTNKQPTVAVPLKQSDYDCGRKDSFVQTQFAMPSHQPSLWSMQSVSMEAEPMPSRAIDLSCHEVDMSVDTVPAPLNRQLSDDGNSLDESHCSPILLDMSSCSEDEDETVDDIDNAAEREQQIRVDRLLSMAEYRDEIYHYLRKAELAHRPRANYMRRQTDITSNMRTILVDWLVEVAEEYHLHRETLFLAVDYIDRFLSVMAVQRSKLQLVGTSAMFIAAKYEEIYPPDIGEFVYITDDTYTQQQVLRMEHLLLKVLTFDVAMPTVHTFCDRFLKEMNADEKTVSMAMYLIELSLLDGDVFLQYVPSITAAAAICLANVSLQSSNPWSLKLAELTQYKMADFMSCLRDLFELLQKAATLPQRAIYEKYRATKFHEVSLLTPPSVFPALSC